MFVRTNERKLKTHIIDINMLSELKDYEQQLNLVDSSVFKTMIQTIRTSITNKSVENLTG